MPAKELFMRSEEPTLREIALAMMSQERLLIELQANMDTLKDIQIQLAVLTNAVKEIQSSKENEVEESKTLSWHSRLLGLFAAVATVVAPLIFAWLVWLHTELNRISTQQQVLETKVLFLQEKLGAKINTIADGNREVRNFWTSSCDRRITF